MKLLLFLLIPFFCMGQRDTSYTVAENYRLFNIHVMWHSDGREVTEKTPITDSATVANFLTREFEKIAISHYKAASTVFFSKQVAVSLEDQNSKFLDGTGHDAGSVLSGIVCKMLGKSVEYDGVKWEMEGCTLKSGDQRNTVRAYCMQWLRVTDAVGNETDLFQIKPGEYKSITGKTLKVKK